MQAHTDYRVLVVDDDERLCESMSRSLIRSGLSVEVAKTTGEGKRLLDDMPFDAVLSDLRLPGGGGFELLKHSRELLEQPVFVMLTGYGSVGVLASALQQGAADYFEKPISGSDLASRLLELLERRDNLNDTESGPTAPTFEELQSSLSEAHGIDNTTAPQHACQNEPRVLVRGRDAASTEELARLVMASGLSTFEMPQDAGPELLDTMAVDTVVVELDEDMPETLAFVRATREADPDVSLVAMSTHPTREIVRLIAEVGTVGWLDKTDSDEEKRSVVTRGVRLRRQARLRERAQGLSGFGDLDTWTDPERCMSDLEAGLARFRVGLQPIVVGDFERSILGYRLVPRVDHQRLLTYEALLMAAECVGRPCAVLERVAELAAEKLQTLPEEKLLFLQMQPRDVSWLASADTELAQHASRVVLEVSSCAGAPPLERAVRSLHDQGYRLARRHHGATFDGINRTARPLPDYIILDRSCVAAIDRSRVRRSIVRTLISTYMNQGILVISSGVETEAEFNTLKDSGCDIFRGPWIAPTVASLTGAIDTGGHSHVPNETGDVE